MHSARAAVTLSHIQTHKHQKLPLRWFSLQWVSPRPHFATMTHTHLRTQKRKALPADAVSAGDNCRGVTVRVPSRFGASSYIENTSGCHIMARACVCERECDRISCVGKFGRASGGSEEEGGGSALVRACWNSLLCRKLFCKSLILVLWSGVSR